MAVIWTEASDGWQILQPSGFPNEAQLHQLIARAPQVLPLSGSPKLVVLGTEVPFESGRADIVAVETSGRPVVIEVKLQNNPESRRAMIAQILAYASNVYGKTPEDLTGALRSSLQKEGFSSIADAVQSADQEGSVELTAFSDALAKNMSAGDIRLVLVLDSAPTELIGVVGYLGAIAPNLTIDLITVTAFQVGDQRVIVPQRIEPAKVEAPTAPKAPSTISGTGTTYSPGPAEFAEGIAVAAPELQSELRRYMQWAESLADAGLATLRTGRGQARWTLVPVVKGGDAGLVTIWNDHGPAVSPWRSALAKWSPQTLAALEKHQPPVQVAQGNALRDVPDDILDLFTGAYEEAAAGGLTLPELETRTPAILIKLGPWQRGFDLDTGRPGHGYKPGMSDEELYQSVRAWWVLDGERARTFKYVVALHNGVTLRAWEVVPDSWKARPAKPGESVRWSFDGVPAPPAITEEFVGPKGKRVPRFRVNGKNVFGQGQPIAYWP